MAEESKATVVVRCKDCEFYTFGDKVVWENGHGRCDHPQLGCEDCYDAWLETSPDAFCSYGEWREKTNGKEKEG